MESGLYEIDNKRYLIREIIYNSKVHINNLLISKEEEKELLINYGTQHFIDKMEINEVNWLKKHVSYHGQGADYLYMSAIILPKNTKVLWNTIHGKQRKQLKLARKHIKKSIDDFNGLLDKYQYDDQVVSLVIRKGKDALNLLQYDFCLDIAFFPYDKTFAYVYVNKKLFEKQAKKIER